MTTFKESEMVCVKFPDRDGNYTDEAELGCRVSGAIYRENHGPDWSRQGILEVRWPTSRNRRLDV